jgi:multiple antibiotic resistance protein
MDVTMDFGPLPVGSVLGAFLLGFPALFSIVNPIGACLTFYNVTLDRSHAERTLLARQIALYSLIILLGSLWLGGYVLNFFGVSLGALRVGGGLVVAIRAWGLLMAPETHEDRKQNDAAPAAVGGDDVAFFPLTMPFTTGPGSISVAIALASERPGHGANVLPFFGGVALAAVAISATVWVLYTFADRVLSRVGAAGARVFTRLAAFLLLCIGVQIVSNGAESLLGPWIADILRNH